MNKPWRTNLIAGGELLLLFAQLVLGLPQLSFTADEPAYIAGGYALLARGGEAFALLSQRGYPPLLCGVEALLIYAAKPDIPVAQLDGWPGNYDLFTTAFQNFLFPRQRAEFVARMPAILLAVLLGALVFRWAKDLWGPAAGTLALAVMIFDPTLLGHGRLAHTDVSTMAFGTAALYAAWRLIKGRSWRWTALLGVLLGLTALSKVSGFLWFASAGLMILVAAVRRHWDGKLLGRMVAAGALGALIWWGGYGFSVGWVSGFPIPVPAPAHWQSSLYLAQYRSEVFAAGRRQYGSWWWYYPLAFAIKNPIPLQIGSAVGLAVLLRHRVSRARVLLLAIFPTIYAVLAILEGMDIGYRHMLPIHPFLYLAIAGGVPPWVRAHPLRKRLAIVLGVWYVAGTVLVFPYEIAYFNELVGGSEGGYRYLVDSNLDWGQSSRVVRAFVRANPGIRLRPPKYTFRPAPGRYVVSASYLQGVGIEGSSTYGWFRYVSPQSTLYYSHLIYDVPLYDLVWFAQCQEPAPPLDADAIASGTGKDALRVVQFECTKAWLYPDGGMTLGIYALHHDLIGEPSLQLPSFLPATPRLTDPFVDERLENARLSYEQEASDELPAFALYEMPIASIEPALPVAAFAVYTDVMPVLAGEATPLDVPVPLDGPLSFLNVVAAIRGEELEIDTWWRVSEGPIAYPFSIVGHLLSDQGEEIGIDDGLGVSPLALLAGDVLVQRHRFPLPSQGETVWLMTGVYWRDTMQHWAVQGAPDSQGLLIRLKVP